MSTPQPVTPLLRLSQALFGPLDDEEEGFFQLPQDIPVQRIHWKWKRPREFGSLTPEGISDATLTITSGYTQVTITDASPVQICISISTYIPHREDFIYNKARHIFPSDILLFWGLPQDDKDEAYDNKRYLYDIPAPDICCIVAKGFKDAGETLNIPDKMFLIWHGA